MTSRTEAAHWLLKKDLPTSVNDLVVILTLFERVVKRQCTSINQTIEAERIRRPTASSSLYHLLVYQVSSRAIKHAEDVRKQYLEGENRPPIQLQIKGNHWSCMHPPNYPVSGREQEL